MPLMSLEVGQGVIGACLLRPQQTDVMAELVAAHEFAAPTHQIV